MDSTKLDELEKAATWAKANPGCPGYEPVQMLVPADTILEMVRELRVLRRALEIAAVETVKNIVFESGGTASQTAIEEEWRAQAERELGEK